MSNGNRRFFYKIKNTGSAVVNNYKISLGYVGGTSVKQTRTDTLMPGSSLTFGNAWSFSPPSMPATFKVSILEVMGITPDSNVNNNESTINVTN